MKVTIDPKGRGKGRMLRNEAGDPVVEVQPDVDPAVIAADLNAAHEARRLVAEKNAFPSPLAHPPDLLVGANEPHDLPSTAVVYEIAHGRDARQVANAAGGIVVIVFDVPERFGSTWCDGSLQTDGATTCPKCGQEIANRCNFIGVIRDEHGT